MKKFGDEFFERVKELIDRDQKSKEIFQNSVDQNKLLEELITHAGFCYDTALKFQFREEIVEKV
jgi:hypothetical protein